MKPFRIRLLIVLLLLACSVTSAVAAEPRAKGKRTKKQPAVVQVVNEETSPAESSAETLAQNKKQPDAVPVENHFDGVPARSWTLVELESMVNSLHPRLQRDQSRIESSRGDALQASLYPNPRFDTNNPQVFAGQNTLLNAGIMQEFVVMGKKRLDTAAAIKVVQQNEFAYLLNRFLLLSALRQQFYVVLAAQRREEALRQLQAVTSSSYETGKALVEQAGEVAMFDVFVLEIDKERVESELESRKRLLSGARKQLAAIVGDTAISHDGLKGSLFDSPPQYDEEVLNRFATMDSAYVQIKKIEIDRNEILLKRAIVEPYPNVTLGPAYQYGLTNGSEQYWLTVTFPIPTWDRNQGNIQSQRADLAMSRMDLEAAKLDQLLQVADLYSKHRAYRIQAAKYEKEIIPNVTKLYRLAKRGYDQRDLDFARFLQVQRTFVETNMDYINLLENVWTSAAQLSGLLQLEEFK